MEIARTLETATAALDLVPLISGDERWIDFSEARDSGTMQRITRLFKRQPPGRWLHMVIASHRGSGKTTELNRLSTDLSDKYFPVYFEANLEMDPNHFEMEDLLLVIARFIEMKMRDKGTPLDPTLLKAIEDWFSEVVFSDEQGKTYLAGVAAEAKLEGGVPFFAKFMASLTSSLRIESLHRESVKRALKKFPSTLMTHVNKLLEAANAMVKRENRELLLIIDNMDRYEPKIIDELLVQSADRFKALETHLIVTPPIDLVLRPKSQSLEAIFPCERIPSIRLRSKEQPYDEFSGPGHGVLLEALEKRIDLKKLIPETAAQDRLILACGGAIRELIEFALDATLEANGDTISLTDVNRVLERRRQRLRDRLDANGYWETLLDMAKTKRVGEGSLYHEVLFQRLAFQYNGEIWYDVHPLITELPDFKQKTKGKADRKKSK